ncbi:MAG: single-stranded DNA-binding protein [Oscillibacter sp.]|jgi:primosomal replication protein N|nr:single-stranded DNA-binding protein [Oscillibacter sp.]
MNERSRNEAELEGIVLSDPVFSHENHGVRFDRFVLRVPRLSGQEDLLPVLAGESLCASIREGAAIRVFGQLRSFNNRTGQGSRLVLTIYAKSILSSTGGFTNTILLTGALCKPPIYRRTPLGRSICDLMLAVSRRCGRADYLPVIAWGQLAAATAHLHVGDTLSLNGRVQSRVYSKVTDSGTEERTAYEVSMMRLLDDSPDEEKEAPTST